MTYIEIINRFWKIHQFDHFSSAEIAVYFYLLNMANRNMWEDEIAVATAELCASIGMRRSTIIRARQSLREKGLIECREGVRNSRTPVYNAVALTEMHRTSVAEWHNVARAPLLAIDDLGTEPREVMEFGNMTAPMRDLLEIRYDRSLPTLISTNMTPADITKRYGDRIGDRMREVMEVVRFRNGSYRR